MQQLQEGLSKLNFQPLPSAGNFILVNMLSDAEFWYQGLLKAGVITRKVGNYGLPNHLRITIGTIEQNQRLLLALEGLQKT